METVIIAEIDELKSRVATMETTIVNFNKIGEQVETVQQQVFSMVKPLTDKNAELEAKVGNLESLNHNLSERMTDLQLQVNIFKSERADPNRSAQGPTSQATQPEQFNVSTPVVESQRGLFAGAGPQEAPRAWTGMQPPGFGNAQPTGPPQTHGAYAAQPHLQPDPRYLAPELLPHLQQPGVQQPQVQPPETAQQPQVQPVANEHKWEPSQYGSGKTIRKDVSYVISRKDTDDLTKFKGGISEFKDWKRKILDHLIIGTPKYETIIEALGKKENAGNQDRTHGLPIGWVQCVGGRKRAMRLHSEVAVGDHFRRPIYAMWWRRSRGQWLRTMAQPSHQLHGQCQQYCPMRRVQECDPLWQMRG